MQEGLAGQRTKLTMTSTNGNKRLAASRLMCPTPMNSNVLSLVRVRAKRAWRLVTTGFSQPAATSPFVAVGKSHHICCGSPNDRQARRGQMALGNDANSPSTGATMSASAWQTRNVTRLNTDSKNLQVIVNDSWTASARRKSGCMKSSSSVVSRNRSKTFEIVGNNVTDML